jgi:hypothetical protein
MRTNFGSLFHDNDRNFLAIFFRQLHQTARGGKSGRPAANDYNIEFHGFAFDYVRHFLFPVIVRTF